ncbi:Dipeptidyl aminopeptidase-like protein 6 DPPX [Takifugu flavidus]|uniref:Dipeptidyl aminopeptidase-like protein 6 DPPX n=1 Tax=Takifugu flavidus TaxID=433684 RepID=A0A5C6NY94_9TELE|nr:Dipeptidyl aminopeptidase-like protein 6 DPPX [Takifugu flavidus]
MASLYQRFSGKINTGSSFPVPPEASRLLGQAEQPAEPQRPGLLHPHSRRCEDEDALQMSDCEGAPSGRGSGAARRGAAHRARREVSEAASLSVVLKRDGNRNVRNQEDEKQQWKRRLSPTIKAAVPAV